MDPEKTQKIQEWLIPKNVKDVQGFLGFGNFNRRFITNYSTIIIPLTEFTKKDVPFIWTTTQQEVFDKFKKVFTSALCLAIFKPGKSVRIETDISDKGVGVCILQQNEEKKWHPIVYMFRKMISAELNYDIHDKELLAIVAVFQIWRVYVEGTSDIIVFTDHKNLINFCITKQLNRRQVR